jgi:hypothetical protein
MKKLLGAVFVTVGLVMVSTTALAHHSGAGEYSNKEWKTISGTVKDFRFINPHPLLLLDVKNDKGIVETWRLQFHAPSRMGRQFGWNSATFKAGDQITIKGHPYFKGLVMTPVYVKFPDGKEEGVYGDVAPNDY